MSSNSARELILPLCMLVSVAAGVAIGGWLMRPATETKAITPRDVGDTQAVVTALDTLRIEVARLRESIERAAVTAPPSARVGAVSDADSSASGVSADLRKVSDSLARTAEILQSAAARVGGDRAPLVPPKIVDPARFERVLDLPREEAVHCFSLWTYQQVLDELGHPTSISNGGGSGVNWFYERSAGNITVQFADGRVFTVDTWRNE